MDAFYGMQPTFIDTVAQYLLPKQKPAENREARQEKPTAENEGGIHDGRMKPMANVVPILEPKEGGKGKEGVLKTGDQE